ncbi:MAG: hypothetical protein NZ570_04820, partial [Candidatus Caldarchaeum sp.]|nr:hypothetical protein [Candidatus Caldarchaeum sp.]
MITRRKAIPFIAGGVGAGLLASYGLLTSHSGQTGQRRKVRDVLEEAGRTGLPDKYVEFLEWLSEVS